MRLGFTPLNTQEDGHTWWELPVSDSWERRKHFISEIDATEP